MQQNTQINYSIQNYNILDNITNSKFSILNMYVLCRFRWVCKTIFAINIYYVSYRGISLFKNIQPNSNWQGRSSKYLTNA